MIWTITLSILLSLLLPGYLLAAPQLVVNDELLKFTWPSVCADSETFSIPISSKEGTVTNLNVAPQDARTPENSTLSADAYSIGKYDRTVTPEGLKISLVLQKSFFLRPGEYKITLLFKGMPAEVQPVSKIVTIVRPAAGINLDELKDRTVKLTRGWPWGTASGECQFSLYEPTKKAAIYQLSSGGSEFFQEKTKVLVPGKVEVSPASQNCLDANSQLPLTLKFSKLAQTGTFNTSILLESPCFDKPIPIPLNLQVTDRWLFPFVVICLGVAGGFGIRYLSKKYKPRQENRYRIARLRGTLDQLLRVTTDSAKAKKLQDFDRRLRDAEDKNLVDGQDGAKLLLDQLEKDVDAFLQQQAIEFADTRKALEELRLKVVAYKAKKIDDPKFNDAAKDLNEAERHLFLNELDQAKDLLKKSQAELKEFEDAHPKPVAAARGKLKEEEDKTITVVNPPENRTTDSTISFHLQGTFPQDCVVKWFFGDATPTVSGGVDNEHTYDRPGNFRVEARVMNEQQVTDLLTRVIMILPGQKEKSLTDIRNSFFYTDLTISGVALVLAAITGLLYLYLGTGKPFGSIQDYLLAFLWGFGIDNSVRGFADVLKKISD